MDQRVQAAIDSYEKFRQAANEAIRDPATFLDGAEPDNDFTQYSWDPMRGEYTAYVMSLGRQGVVFRGDPPEPQLKVMSVDLDATPHPTVVLEDCYDPTAPWASYVQKTGDRVPLASGQASRPYRLTVTVIFYKGRWGTMDSAGDQSQPCTA